MLKKCKMRNKKFIYHLTVFMLLFTMLFSVAYPLGAMAEGVQLVFSEDFNSYTVGTAPTGWTSTSATSTSADSSGNFQKWALTVDDRFTTNSLKVALSSPMGKITGYSSYTLPNVVTGKMTFMYSVCANSTNNRGYFGLKDSLGKTLFQMSLYYDGKFTLDSGAKLQTYVAGTWYNVKLMIDPNMTASDNTVGAADIYINDVLLAPKVPFPSGSSKDVAGFYTSINAWNPATNYYDDIKIYNGVVPVSSITLDKTSATMYMADPKLQLNATVMPTDAADKTITWSSSNTSVATVDSTGLITQVDDGTATITATTNDSGLKATCLVTVKNPKVASIAIKQTSVNILQGEKEALQTAFTPVDATNKSVTWASSDTAIATVDEYGMVTALSNGTATITATSVEGNHTATCTVNVGTPHSVGATYYVAPTGDDNNNGSEAQPFKTIQKARDTVRTINSDMEGDIYVYLRGGLYSVLNAIEFDERDSGTNGYNVVYKAYNSEIPVFSGGQKVTGWTLYDSAKNIYKANFGEAIDTRQLFVNGVRASRAKSTVGLTNVVNSDVGHKTTDTFIASYKNITDLEMVYYAIWTNPRCPVSSVTTNTDGTILLNMLQPAYGNCKNKGLTSITSPSYYENAYELLDVAGEWYLDKTGAISGTPYTFFYKPNAGENMATADVVAPTAEKLIIVKGSDIDNLVSHIQFEGITFKHTTWLRPNAYGVSDAQNFVMRESYSQPKLDYIAPGETIVDGAAITLKYAHNIKFHRNKLSDLGASGFVMYSGCQNNLFVGNSIKDISGTGMQFGEVTNFKSDTTAEFGPDPSDKRNILKSNNVINNYIYNYGLEYRSATGFAMVWQQDAIIAHNEIGMGNYTGMHIGWGWGTFPKTVAQNNIIEKNYVHDTMRVLNDGGGVYTLGAQGSASKPSIIRYNYITNSRNQGLYWDNGSTWWYANDNVFDGISDGIIQMSGADKTNIHTYNSFATKSYLKVQNPPQTVSTIHTPIIKIGSTWNATAQNIIDNAGLEASYKDIKN